MIFVHVVRRPFAVRSPVVAVMLLAVASWAAAAHLPAQNKTSLISGTLVRLNPAFLEVKTDTGTQLVEINAQTLYENFETKKPARRGDLSVGQTVFVETVQNDKGNFARKVRFVPDKNKHSTRLSQPLQSKLTA